METYEKHNAGSFFGRILQRNFGMYSIPFTLPALQKPQIVSKAAQHGAILEPMY
ncbi:MAG: hypothetical protein PUC06_00460 [Oscillospiraceae bacterium]|nr:hypothetical protein [Oscillospiraceae bacterium]